MTELFACCLECTTSCTDKQLLRTLVLNQGLTEKRESTKPAKTDAVFNEHGKTHENDEKPEIGRVNGKQTF